MDAFAPLAAALAACGDDVWVEREDGTLTGTNTLAGIAAARERAGSLPVDLAPGDLVALRGRLVALQVAAPLTAWSLGLCVQLLGDREPASSLDGLLAASGARLVLGWSAGAFEGLPVRNPRRVTLPAGTLLATSGTSGRPKLVAHGLAQHVDAARGAVAALDIRPGDRLLLTLPTWHVGGLSIVLRALLGGAVLCVPSPDTSLEDALARFRPTHVSLVATQLRRLLAAPATCAALRACRAVLLGGGPIPAALRAAALAQGVPVAVGYGATETLAFVTLAMDADLVARDACAGRALPGRTVVVDEGGAIRLGGPSLLTGYLVDGALEDPRDAQGLWSSGDVGRLEDGVLYVTGRCDRRFVSGGENVQPEEIEQGLLAVDGVTDAVVVPVPSEEFGLRPVAFVAAAGLSATALDAALRELLPGFKTPDAYYRLPAPAGASPKPDLARLRALAADPQAALQLERLA